MRRVPPSVGAVFLGPAFVLASSLSAQTAAGPQQLPGELLPPSAVSPVTLVEMADVIERDKAVVYDDRIHGVWNGEDGRWFVPPMSARTPVHSGEKALVNEWGDPTIGIAFGRAVDVTSVFLGGHGVAPAPHLVVVGYRDGVELTRTERIVLEPGSSHAVDLGFEAVDRIGFQAAPAAGAMGFFALDDLAFRRHGASGPSTVLDFEDLSWRTVLTGGHYAGLDWETGTGLRGVQLDGTQIVAAPKTLGTEKGTATTPVYGPTILGSTTGGTAPTVTTNFRGPRQGDPGGGWIPPDTCGAVGPDHFVSVVNANLSAWRKSDGARLFNVGLNSFFNQTVGDPRAAWDSHGQRFVVLATDFTRSKTIYVGVTRTADPTGAWYTFSFRTDQSSDAGRWPDYPTLGVDARGIYTSAYMVGSGARMTIWAIPTAPLYQTNPTTPPITAFRTLPWEGAIQPCVTYGDPGVQYLVSRSSRSSLRLRRIAWSGTTASLFEHGIVPVPSHSSPPDAPALGSSTAISTIDYRPINAIYRNGSVWTVHTISVGGKAAVRWYEIDTSNRQTVQVGTITDPVWHYYYGSIAVDARGDVALGFSGSHSGSYVNGYVTGRLASDAAGTVAAPIQIKAGEGAYQRLDSGGRNRWGDYSLTSVDPVDDIGFWSIQEYARPGNTWSTWIARLGYEAFCYGDGLAGTNGVPAIGTAGRPVLGAVMPITIDNSSGSAAAGVLVIGIATANTPALGGTLLVQPLITADVTIATPQASVPLTVPNAPAMVGASIFFQAIQVDAGAVQGVSFTQGLEVRPVTR